MLDLLLRNANLPDGRRGIDIAVQDGRIVEVRPSIAAAARREIDAGGRLVTPPFVDAHLHLDSALILTGDRQNESGTLLEGISLWAELKPHITVEEIKRRALAFCRWSVARGNLAIRSHVDISDDRLLAVDALLAVKREMAPFIDIQLVAFPQDGFFRYPKSRENLLRALDMGVDVVGGIPHFERTMADGAASVRALAAYPRAHAAIVRDAEGHYVLRDQNSTNGTWVNGHPVTEHILEDGDTIKLGATVLAIRMPHTND
jgi:cytosine deaminase